MPDEQKIKEVIETLTRLQEDTTIPKNVKIKIRNIITALKEKNTEPSIKINEALHQLDEIADDANMQPYTRTQIWNVVSMLEKL